MRVTKQGFDSPLQVPNLGSSCSLWNVGTFETFLPGDLKLKTRQERVLIKEKLFAPYIQFTFAFYLRMNTKKKKRENWFSHNVFSLTAFKILTLTSKLYSNPFKQLFLKQFFNRTNTFEVWLKSGADEIFNHFLSSL